MTLEKLIKIIKYFVFTVLIVMTLIAIGVSFYWDIQVMIVLFKKSFAMDERFMKHINEAMIISCFCILIDFIYYRTLIKKGEKK